MWEQNPSRRLNPRQKSGSPSEIMILAEAKETREGEKKSKQHGFFVLFQDDEGKSRAFFFSAGEPYEGLKWGYMAAANREDKARCINKINGGEVFHRFPLLCSYSTRWLSPPFSLSPRTCPLKQSRFICICLESETSTFPAFVRHTC